MLYSITDGMKPIKVDDKNDLKIGQVLQLVGYQGQQYMIADNLGVNERFSSHGASYLTIDLDSFQFTRHQASDFKWAADQKDGRIQVYITDEIMPAQQVTDLTMLASRIAKAKEIACATAEVELERLEVLGRDRFEKHIPASAKALIVAECREDETDLHTDYFGSRGTSLVILGYSTHTRNLFPELRKHAGLIPETTPLANASKECEHRENYSMGHGNYLKDGYYDRSGWMVCKQRKWAATWDSSLFISMGRRCIFEGEK